MKKWVVLGMFVFSTLFFARPLLAHGENMGEHIQVMRQAANELQATNPDLSKKLNDFADKKEKWKGEGKEEWAKNLEQKRQDLTKVREAAGALKNQNGGLSNDLNGIADRWEKKLQDKQEKWDDKKKA